MKNLVPHTFNELLAMSVAIVAVIGYAHTWWQL